MASLIALGAIAAQAGGQPTGPSTVPDSLTNAQFWSIVSEFSEAGGTFPSDNFTSNEMSIGRIAAQLVAEGHTRINAAPPRLPAASCLTYADISIHSPHGQSGNDG
jgi:hypothetical protein